MQGFVCVLGGLCFIGMQVCLTEVAYFQKCGKKIIPSEVHPKK